MSVRLPGGASFGTRRHARVAGLPAELLRELERAGVNRAGATRDPDVSLRVFLALETCDLHLLGFDL